LASSDSLSHHDTTNRAANRSTDKSAREPPYRAGLISEPITVPSTAETPANTPDTEETTAKPKGYVSKKKVQEAVTSAKIKITAYKILLMGIPFPENVFSLFLDLIFPVVFITTPLFMPVGILDSSVCPNNPRWGTGFQAPNPFPLVSILYSIPSADPVGIRLPFFGCRRQSVSGKHPFSQRKKFPYRSPPKPNGKRQGK
jgi:hypothetical protein